MIVGIDPGTLKSGVAALSGKRIVFHAVLGNEELRNWIVDHAEEIETLGCEEFRSYGMAIGETSITTIKWIGRFEEIAFNLGLPFRLIPKKGTNGVNDIICHDQRAKDPNIRRSLIDLFNPDGRSDKEMIGTKKSPGPLYGVNSHEWPAIAVAYCIQTQDQNANPA